MEIKLVLFRLIIVLRWYCDKVIDIFACAGGETMANENDVPFLGRIPIDPDLATACDTGRPFIYHSQHKPAAQAFSKVLEELLKQIKIK